MYAFFAMPSRGGKLTILNCFLWAIVGAGIAFHLPLLLLPALIAWWPLAWLWIIVVPVVNHFSEASREGVLWVCAWIGLNSFCWGYGLSWLLTRFADRRRATADERIRGFEVIHSTPPEHLSAADA